MSILFVNAAFREGSSTYLLARDYIRTHWKEREKDIIELDLGASWVTGLNRDRLRIYMEGTQRQDFSEDLFQRAREFAAADTILLAAPLWNMGLPAVLSDYLELVCTRGITFGYDSEGNRFSMCRAKELVFVTTSGGPIPEVNHAFGYIKTLSDYFFRIPRLVYVRRSGAGSRGGGPDQQPVVEEVF